MMYGPSRRTVYGGSYGGGSGGAYSGGYFSSVAAWGDISAYGGSSGSSSYLHSSRSLYSARAGVEQAFVSHAIARISRSPTPVYGGLSSSVGLYLSRRGSSAGCVGGEPFVADAFLDLGVPQRFVGSAEEIAPFVEEAFVAVTGHDLPSDVRIHVCSDDELKRAHVGRWDDGIQGFTFNRNGWGVSEIFVRRGRIDRVLLTVGHELGHALTQPLQNEIDEEAKAFAFSMAWMEAVHDRNIAGLSQSVNPRPAENGLHDVAFAFAARLVNAGSRALDVFKDLVRGAVSISRECEQIIVACNDSCSESKARW